MTDSGSKAPVEAAPKVPKIPGVTEADVRKIRGITEEDVREAMEYPGAAAEVEGLLAAERTSVQQGEFAPDFRLPRLSGAEVDERVGRSSYRSAGRAFG